MTNHTDGELPEPAVPVAAGISRRELIRRGAVVGGAGALAWAAPAVTTFGARAFAAEGTDVPVPGSVSYVIVWFKIGNIYHVVKYEGGANGYAETCNATRNNVSNDGPEGFTYFDKQQGKVQSGLTRSTSCPTPDLVGVSSVDGLLRLTLAEGVEIIGWILHDGSCQNPPGQNAPRFRSVEYPYKTFGDKSSGVVGPVSSKDLKKGGAFEWRQCR